MDHFQERLFSEMTTTNIIIVWSEGKSSRSRWIPAARVLLILEAAGYLHFHFFRQDEIQSKALRKPGKPYFILQHFSPILTDAMASFMSMYEYNHINVACRSVFYNEK